MERDLNRRDFIKTVAGAGAAALSAHVGIAFAGQSRGTPEQKAAPTGKTITMIALPYAQDALAPYISARTVDLHYNKHHMSYYTQLTGWIGTHPEFANQTIDELILKNRYGIEFAEAVFYYSILLNNHNFYWQSLKPKAGGAPTGAIAALVEGSFGSYEAFRKRFIDEAMHLGVGWVWVALDGKALKVYWSEYHDTPILKGYVPLLACDVWEHAYYMDYQNDRRKYVEAVLDHLLNWEYAETRLSSSGR
jgi:superoxide dismutase, Fe-Mn family